MRLLVAIFILAIGFFAVVNCTGKKYDEQKPKNFSFRICNDIDSYDSRSGVFLRRYFPKDSVVRVYLSQDEIVLIYDLFKKYDYLSFPLYFECPEDAGRMFPASSNTLEIWYKGYCLRNSNSSYCDKKIDQAKSDKFDRFNLEVWKIIKNKKQIKAMRESDMFFL